MNIQPMICAAFVMGATVFSNVDANANQEYPTKPIKIIVGFSAGGGSDLVARILADTLGKKLNQSVIVENKPGAGGVLATKSVAREKPDGYTLIMGSAAAFVINPYLIRDIGYDPINDFTPIGSVARFQYVLMGRDNLAVSTLAQLIDYAKKHPDALNIGSAGIGSNTHLVALSFMAKTGIKLTHVPYKGTAGALNDLQGRNIDLLFDSVPTVTAHVLAGRVKAFGTTGLKRENGLPQLTTLAELGTPDFTASNWFALFGPAGVDSVITNKLNKAINDSLSDPELQRRFEAGGNTPLMGASTDLANLVQQESAMYRKLINDTGIRID